MSAWEIFITVASWLGVVLGLSLIAYIVWLFMDAMLDTISKRIKKRKAGAKVEDYMEEATRMGLSMYKDEMLMADELLTAFRSGARWGWGFFHRK